MDDWFLKLSQDLVADTTLPPARAARFLQRIRAVADPAALAQLETVATGLPADQSQREHLIESQIMAVDPLRELAKLIIILWYTGDMATATGDPPPTEEDYFSAMLWPTIRAHPPGISGGYFGHWTYPPDN